MLAKTGMAIGFGTMRLYSLDLVRRMHMHTSIGGHYHAQKR